MLWSHGYEVRTWRQDEQRLSEGWDELSINERSTVSDQWRSSLHAAIAALEAPKKGASKL